MPIYKKINRQFFKKWTKDMAYVLGFFAADGYMTINKHGTQYWCISITDKKLVEDIRRKVDSNHKISVRIGKGNNRDQYRIQIGSKIMCEDLRKLGFFKNKIKNLSVPNVPDKFFNCFVRGYFDGDGHVWTGWIHKERKTQTHAIQTVFTSCSQKFLSTLGRRLKDFYIDNGVIRREKRGYFRLVYSIKNSLKLYYFMYNDLVPGSLYLNRKKIVFDKYIKLRL